MSAADLFPLGDGAVMCLHPDQVHAQRTTRPWAKLRNGRRWSVMRCEPVTVVTTTCPDCPQIHQLRRLPGSAGFAVQMPPFLFVPEGVAL